MDAATAALAGAGIGAVVTLAGTFGGSFLQDRRERAARREQAVAQLEQERRTEYVKLLTCARDLRYVALRRFEQLDTRPVSEVDRLLTQLSAAYYMIVLTAPKDTSALALELRDAIFDLSRKARDHPESKDYKTDIRRVRAIVDRFRLHVRAELDLSGVGHEP
jgi:hypothetical protein